MSITTKDLLEYPKRNPLLAVCVLLTILLLVLIYLRLDAPALIQGSIDDRRKNLVTLRANVKNATQLIEHAEELKKANLAIAQHALREGDLAGHQQFFLLLESESTVTLLEFRLVAAPTTAPVKPAKGAKASATAATSAYVPLRFSLSVSGEYPNLIALAKRIERSPTLGRIVSASVSAASPETSMMSMSMVVELLGVRP